jgi:spore coat polysaccharide biosynthesis protein SpsF (cytidylyltransferase family)
VPNDYEKFQELTFDHLDDLEVLGKQRTIEDFVRAGQKFGIDVIAEIVDKKRSVSEVVAQIRQKEVEAKPPQ